MSTSNPAFKTWQGQRVWVIGASSGIGAATAAHLARLGAQVVVSARSVHLLSRLQEQHPTLEVEPLDVTHHPACLAAAERVCQRAGGIDHVIFCVGHYREQRATAFDLSEMLKHQSINYVGALHVLDAVLPFMLAQKRGHLTLISSVAGYRGLPKALAYGPTKAALHNLAEILYLDLKPQGIAVSVVSPGFVDTPLTAQNRFKMPALISPEQAAAALIHGVQRGDFDIHFPKRFTLMLKLLALLPARWYLPLIQRAIT